MDEILTKAKNGDRAALEELLKREQTRIYRFGMKMCGDPQDAQDVLQDTLLAMARTVEGFKEASSISTWLYTIARSFCIKKHRKRKHAPEHYQSIDHAQYGEPLVLLDQSKGPEETASDNQTKVAIEQAILDLQLEYREVLLLRDVEGLTASEVADVLDISVAAVKSRLHRARSQLRQRMEQLLELPNRAKASKRTDACPDITELLSRHLEGDLSSNLCVQMEKHVAACDTCRSQCELLKQTLRLCAASKTDKVPQDVKQAVQQALTQYLKSH